MRKVVCTNFGPPSSRLVQEVDKPTPQPDGVVLDVAAAGVNFLDALIVSGKYQVRPPLPFTPGGEVAGAVAAVGDAVAGWAIGDRAVAMVGAGGSAERVAVPAARLLAVPSNSGLAQAACCIRPPEPSTYPLEQAGAALTAMLGRATTGKVALVI
jgi:NADPH:quinone reductase